LIILPKKFKAQFLKKELIMANGGAKTVKIYAMYNSFITKQMKSETIGKEGS
jgi:hypothetical protein